MMLIDLHLIILPETNETRKKKNKQGQLFLIKGGVKFVVVGDIIKNEKENEREKDRLWY